MYAEAAGAIGSIKAALEIAKGVSALKSETEINRALIDIQRALLDAQASAFDDRERISELLNENKKLQSDLDRNSDWDQQKSRYQLTQSPLGAYTYDLIPEVADGEPLHRLCAKCFQDGHKSILNTISKGRGGEKVNCPTCKTDFLLAKFGDPIVSIPRQRTAWSDY